MGEVVLRTSHARLERLHTQKTHFNFTYENIHVTNRTDYRIAGIFRAGGYKCSQFLLIKHVPQT